MKATLRSINASNITVPKQVASTVSESRTKLFTTVVVTYSRVAQCNANTRSAACLTIMRRTCERGTKARLSFSGGPHAPVNVADSMEEVSVGGKIRRKWHSGNFCCAVLRYISYTKFS